MKNILITGVSTGLGYHACSYLLNKGYRVLGSVRKQEDAQSLRDEFGPNFTPLVFDVTDTQAVKAAIPAVREAVGTEGLYALVNNAGVGSVANIEEESFENWRRVHAIDLDSVFLGSKYAIPLIAASGGGSIVNISSISGIIAGHNLAAYNSAKAGVRHLSKSIALHCAKAGNGIRCNSVHPVFIDTPILDRIAAGQDRAVALEKLSRQIPLGRVGRPDDVAYAVLYLASDESAFVTGSEIRVDGGISAM